MVGNNELVLTLLSRCPLLKDFEVHEPETYGGIISSGSSVCITREIVVYSPNRDQIFIVKDWEFGKHWVMCDSSYTTLFCRKGDLVRLGFLDGR